MWFPSGRSTTSNSCSPTLAAMQEFAPWPCHMTKGTHKAAPSGQTLRKTARAGLRFVAIFNFLQFSAKLRYLLQYCIRNSKFDPDYI